MKKEELLKKLTGRLTNHPHRILDSMPKPDSCEPEKFLLEWQTAGSPYEWVRVRNDIVGIEIYQDIAYGGILLVQENSIFYGKDIVYNGNLSVVVLGDYYTAHGIKIYREIPERR